MNNSYFGKRLITINVMGSPGVGKSSLLYSLFNQNFNPNNKFDNNNTWPNSYSFYCGKCEFDLKFEETNSTIITYDEIQKYDALIILYSLVDKNSFDNLNYFLDLYKKYNNYMLSSNATSSTIPIPIIIVGTKLDAPNQITPSLKEIELLKIPYYEINSSDIDSIHHLLNLLLYSISKKEEILIKKNEKLLKDINRIQRQQKLKKKYLSSIPSSSSLINIFSKMNILK